MNAAQKQNFYSISMLPIFVGQIDQLIEALEEKHKLFIKAKTSLVLQNTSIVNKALIVFQKNTEHIGCYYEQLIKWRKEVSTDTQNKSLDIFAQKIAYVRNLNTKLINLAKELKETTINKILKEDNFKLGLDFLSENRRK